MWARWVAIVAGYLLLVGTVLAVDEFDLRVPLKRAERGVSASGTNAICLPYDIPSSRNVASELEAYLVQVTGSAVWTPATFTTGEVTVDITERRPGACDGPVDGGKVEVDHQGVGYEVSVDWEHDLYNNLVFEPEAPGGSADLSACTGDPPPSYCCSDTSKGEWKGGTCTPPGSLDPGGECTGLGSDVVNSEYICGCEIRPPLDSITGERNCNNVGCGSLTDCDNTIDECSDPDAVFCDVLHDGYTFAVGSVSFDDG